MRSVHALRAAVGLLWPGTPPWRCFGVISAIGLWHLVRQFLPHLGHVGRPCNNCNPAPGQGRADQQLSVPMRGLTALARDIRVSVGGAGDPPAVRRAHRPARARPSGGAAEPPLGGCDKLASTANCRACQRWESAAVRCVARALRAPCQQLLDHHGLSIGATAPLGASWTRLVRVAGQQLSDH